MQLLWWAKIQVVKSKTHFSSEKKTLSVLEAIHRGMHSSRPAPRPAVRRPQRPSRCRSVSCITSATLNKSFISHLPAFAGFFFLTYITGEEMDPPADVTGVSFVCARGVCKWDACVAKRNTEFLGWWCLEEQKWSTISAGKKLLEFLLSKGHFFFYFNLF